MRVKRGASTPPGETIPKTPTGIEGFDEITGGGLPRGRPTLLCGGAGSGKTLFSAEFLVRGATQFGEPGVFVAFEETEEDLVRNVASLGFDLRGLIARRQLCIDYVHIERTEIEETGEYDLEAFFLRLGHAIDSIGARRVVLDTLEALFAGLANEGILRAELRRLFRWLKVRKVTAIITAEQGAGTLTRHGLEEYVSDCVVVLDHRVRDQIAIRRMRVVKYRGSVHGTSEYPFLISERGISVLPISTIGLSYGAPVTRQPTGIKQLDAMLGGRGIYRGSTVLVSGSSGTGKSSFAAHFAAAVCRSGKRCLYFAMEESPEQIIRNMRSIGLDLRPWIARACLRITAYRPTQFGLEAHLLAMYHEVLTFRPDAVVLDPITDLGMIGSSQEIKSMLMRLIDVLKSRQITALLTSVLQEPDRVRTESDISSLIDTWIVLRFVESGSERNRTVHVLKSRGMAHSNQMREMRFTGKGIEFLPPYLEPGGMMTGLARIAQESRDKADGSRRVKLAPRPRSARVRAHRR